MLNNILNRRASARPEEQFLSPLNKSSDLEMFSQGAFHKMLSLERKRIERSHRGFVLMLVDSDKLFSTGNNSPCLATILSAVSQSKRDTDIKGWFSAKSVIGVIFTEVDPVAARSVAQSLSSRVLNALSRSLEIEQFKLITISVHVFPEDWSNVGQGGITASAVQMDSARSMNNATPSLQIKRAMDIMGSLLALVLLLPVFISIAIAIKLTSRGPVLFRQVRLGQYGKQFTFLKFRSMYFQSNQRIHEEYTQRLITGAIHLEKETGQQRNQYKLTADPRVTSVGKFLRKTSLDELPQFLNILRGEMSLVGPRPPVTYEVQCYDLWHTQRLQAVKPGLTGLWQVEGRSRVNFDDMVRLDIRYARSWSLWLDIKILLRTPLAVVSGNGAY